MPDLTTCSVCQRPDRSDVDAALDAGEPIAATARRFGIIRTTLQRHIKHRDAKPGKAPEHDAGHPEAEPASAALPEPVPVVPPETPALPDPAPAAPLPPSAPIPRPAPPPALPPPPGEKSAPAPAEPTAGNVIAFPGGRARPGPGRVCTCCSSEWRQDIDQMLCSGMSAKAIEATLAPRGPSDDAIRHHARRCIPGLLAGRDEGLRAEILTTVRDRAERLMGKAERLVEEADGSVLCANCQEPTEPASPRDRAATINAANSVIVTLGKLLGELGADVDVRVVLDSPRFAAEREAIQRALRRHPAARAAGPLAVRGRWERRARRSVHCPPAPRWARGAHRGQGGQRPGERSTRPHARLLRHGRGRLLRRRQRRQERPGAV